MHNNFFDTNTYMYISRKRNVAIRAQSIYENYWKFHAYS